MGCKKSKPDLNLFNCFNKKEESFRPFPLSNWTELDIWQYIYVEKIPIVPLYFSKKRPVVKFGDDLIMIYYNRLENIDYKKIEIKNIRFRTLGCYPLTGAVLSEADSIEKIILELLNSKFSERNGRSIDKDALHSMEKKKLLLMKLSKSKEKTLTISKVNNYINTQASKHLSFLTCGSVDDGKSTLRRLLYEANLIFDDEKTITTESEIRTQGKNLDFALFVYGLS